MHRPLTKTDLRRASLAPYRPTLADIIRDLHSRIITGTLLTPKLRPRKKDKPE